MPIGVSCQYRFCSPYVQLSVVLLYNQTTEREGSQSQDLLAHTSYVMTVSQYFAIYTYSLHVHDLTLFIMNYIITISLFIIGMVFGVSFHAPHNMGKISNM